MPQPTLAAELRQQAEVALRRGDRVTVSPVALLALLSDSEALQQVRRDTSAMVSCGETIGQAP